MTEDNFRYAGFWLRCLAFIIDMLLFNLVAGLFFMILTIVLGAIIYFIGGASFLLFIIPGILYVISLWLYYALMESGNDQGTIGKKLLKIKVVDENNNSITFKKATKRYFAKYISMLIIFGGFIMIAFTKRKQGLHDIISNCFVLKK